MTILHISAGIAPPGATMGPDGGTCCYGTAVYNDPGRCTCWQVVLDMPDGMDRIQEGPMNARGLCCHDCAYRNGSPERERDEDLPMRPGRPFHCHRGMPKIARWEHPDGRVIEATEDSYVPYQRAGRSWMGDGAPAELCAGWLAHALGGR